MARINIVGIIGDEYTYGKFLTEYASTGVEPIHLYINSDGGSVNEGEQIADFINKHAERFLTVSNTGNVASISASIFMALEREKRFFDTTKGVFLIHNPYADPLSMKFADTTSEGLALMADQLQAVEDRIAKFISKQTGTELEVVKGLMKINQPLDDSQIEALNIATIYKYKAVAFLNTNNNNNDKMTKEEVQEIVDNSNATFLDKLKALFSPKFKALMVTAGDGSQIDFPEVPDEATVNIGDKAADASLNGEVVMATGEIYVFENGVLMEIKPVVEEVPTEDVEALKAEIERLKAENTKALAQKAVAMKELVTVKAQFKSQMTKDEPEQKEEKTGDVPTRKLSEIRK